MTSSLEKLAQYVKHVRTQKGLTQKEISLMIFDKANTKYIGKLERGTLEGMTLNTADRIMLALNSEINFREYEK